MHIPLDAPLLAGNEKKYLNTCIDTNWISWQGEFVGRLEQSIAEYCGANHGLSIINGTYALVVALRTLGVGPGDEVIVPTLTMSATPFAVSSVGATVVWADCAVDSINSEAAQIKEKITSKTKAIIAVHLYGTPCDINAIRAAAPGIPIIEDAAESFGAAINGQRVGSLGDLACHSFHNKIIASGEGGAITFNDSKYKEQILSLRTPSENNSSGSELCLNNRMSNIAAAIALAQLENVDSLITARRQVAKVYDRKFNGKIKTLKEQHRNVFWRYQIFVDSTKRSKIIDYLKSNGIESRPVFSLMNRHPYYNCTAQFSQAELISNTGIDIPTSPAMTVDQAEYVADTVLSAAEIIL